MTKLANTDIPQRPVTPRQLFLELAIHFGIGREVAELLKGRPMPEPIGLGPTLRHARKRQGGTIYKTFVRSGISRSQLSFYEGGGQRNPGLRTIQALSYGYRVPFAAVVIAVLHDMGREVPTAPGAAELDISQVRKRKRTGVR